MSDHTANSFQIHALPIEPFTDLFALDDAALAARGARRLPVHESPGFPCRVSFEDGAPGETVIALTHEHHPVDSPYRSAGPIFIRESARPASVAPGEIPQFFRHRLVSVRGYDNDAMMVQAGVVPGESLEAEIARQFEAPGVAYIHLHNAGPGCFMCTVERVD